MRFDTKVVRGGITPCPTTGAIPPPNPSERNTRRGPSNQDALKHFAGGGNAKPKTKPLLP